MLSTGVLYCSRRIEDGWKFHGYLFCGSVDTLFFSLVSQLVPVGTLLAVPSYIRRNGRYSGYRVQSFFFQIADCVVGFIASAPHGWIILQASGRVPINNPTVKKYL